MLFCSSSIAKPFICFSFTILRSHHQVACSLVECQSHCTSPLTSLQCGALFQNFTNSRFISQGLQLHAYSITAGRLVKNIYLITKIAAFYASCGRMVAARELFDGMPVKNSFLWNSLIRGYTCHGYPKEAIELFVNMLESEQVPDKFTYPFLIRACGDLRSLKMGRAANGLVIVNGINHDVYVGNALLFMYGKLDAMKSSNVVFGRMAFKDLTSWNTMISTFVLNGNSGEGLKIYYSMRETGIHADYITLVAILSACANLAAVSLGKQIHAYVFRSGYMFVNSLIGNSLIDLYGKCKTMMDARRVFESMRYKDTVSWNSLIEGYAYNDDAYHSFRTFIKMVSEGSNPDEATFISILKSCNPITALQFGMSIHAILTKKGWNSSHLVGTTLLDMYAKCGSLDCSVQVFKYLPLRSLVTFTAMINGYGLHGGGKEGIDLFNEMISCGIVPDGAAFLSVLSACSHSGMVEEGKELFNKMTKEWHINPKLEHYSCFVDLLARSGHLKEAYEIIFSMNLKDKDTWAALLNACRVHNNLELAKEVSKTAELQVGSYVCLSNIYAAENLWEEAEKVREFARKKGMLKAAGCSFVEVDRVVYRFVAGEKSHKDSKEIRRKLEELDELVRLNGYEPDTSCVLHNVEEEVKKLMLWDHSERWALAFALVKTNPRSVIRITKNLRVCSDCHAVIKLISKLTFRKIVMRDIRRFHHFEDGVCSCGDFW